MNPIEIAAAVEYVKDFGAELMEDLTKYMGNIQTFHKDLFSDDYEIKCVPRSLVEKWAHAWAFGKTGDYYIVNRYRSCIKRWT